MKYNPDTISVEGLSVSFGGQHSVQAVEDVHLELAPGQKMAVIGETGSGKSVLLLAMLRLLPPTAQVRGAVHYRGEDLLCIKEKALRKVRGAQIAYVPQGGGGSLNPLMRVGFQVGEPLFEHRRHSRRQAMEAGISLLDRFHIDHPAQRAAEYPHTFSGGMRQRAMVAMGIAAGANVILADEPTKGLDEARVAQVRDAFLSLDKKAILCVTHDLAFAREIARDIHVMYAAQQVECAPREALLREPLHPYTKDMLAAMPENGLRAEKGFAPPHKGSVEGCRYLGRCRVKCARCTQAPPMIEVYKGHKVRCWQYANLHRPPEQMLPHEG